MLDKKLVELLNTQIQMEFYSAYLYLDFADYYSDASLDGFSNWYKVQAEEERDHAMLIVQYMQNNSERVTYKVVDAPAAKLAKHIDPLVAAAEHEREVTASINNIYAEASKLKDYRTMQFLDWFVKEQGEEEMNADNNVDQFKLFGEDSKGLFELDREMGTRTYSAPSLVL